MKNILSVIHFLLTIILKQLTMSQTINNAEMNVNQCILHVLESTLFKSFEGNKTLDKVYNYLADSLEVDSEDKIDILNKVIKELTKMNKKIKDERLTDSISCINFLISVLENQCNILFDFFVISFPFHTIHENDDSDYEPSDTEDDEDSEYESEDENDDEDSEDEDSEDDESEDEDSDDEDSDDEDSEDEDSEDEDIEDEDSEDEDSEDEDSEDDDEDSEVDLDDKPLNYSLSRDCLMALISVLCKLPSAKVLSLDFDDELVSVEEFLCEAISDFVLNYDVKNEEAMYYLDEDLERVIELLDGVYEDVPEKHEEQIFLIRDRLIWARMMLEMEESDFLKELKVFHIKGIKLNKN